MSTLLEDKEMLTELSIDMKQGSTGAKSQLIEYYRKFCQEVPVSMAYGGKNKGHETIQKRFLRWRKGTIANNIYTWFHSRGITEY